MPKRAQARIMLAADDEPTRVWMPDALWKNKSISHTAKLLWCYLRIAQRTHDRFGFRELREAIGVCQNTLAACLNQLKVTGWLQVKDRRRYSISCLAVWRRGRQKIIMESDILFDPRVPEPAKWLWGLIVRQTTPFTYELLERETRYCRETLVKYLRMLSDLGWLKKNRGWVNRRAQFQAIAMNPAEGKRRAELAEKERGFALAAKRPGYSKGQEIATEMTLFLVPDGNLIRNAEMVGLVNPETGGQMHLDLYLARYQVAVEFNGPQHERLTELYSDPNALEAQRRRDELKREWCRKRGIKLIAIGAEDLDFSRLIALLSPHMPLNTSKRGRWHVFRFLERIARNYRLKAAQHK